MVGGCSTSLKVEILGSGTFVQGTRMHPSSTFSVYAGMERRFFVVHFRMYSVRNSIFLCAYGGNMMNCCLDKTVLAAQDCENQKANLTFVILTKFMGRC
jgi:hypothetical protein